MIISENKYNISKNIYVKYIVLFHYGYVGITKKDRYSNQLFDKNQCLGFQYKMWSNKYRHILSIHSSCNIPRVYTDKGVFMALIYIIDDKI